MEVVRRLIVVIIWLTATPLMFAFALDQNNDFELYNFEWYAQGITQAMFAFVPACILHALVNWIAMGAKKPPQSNHRDDPDL